MRAETPALLLKLALIGTMGTGVIAAGAAGAQTASQTPATPPAPPSFSVPGFRRGPGAVGQADQQALAAGGGCPDRGDVVKKGQIGGAAA